MVARAGGRRASVLCAERDAAARALQAPAQPVARAWARGDIAGTASGVVGLVSLAGASLLSTVLNEVGAHRGATWFLAEGQDCLLYTSPSPRNRG